MELQGELIEIEETKEYGQNGFLKRRCVVRTNDPYPQEIPIDFIKDKCSLLDAFNVGDQVSVSINLRGNEYNGKRYVDVQGWLIAKQPI